MPRPVHRAPDARELPLRALRELFRTSPIGMWARDRNGRAILQNNLITRMWGDLIGSTVARTPATAAERALWRRNNRMALGGKTIRYEAAASVRCGERWLEHVVGPLRVGGRIAGVLGFVIDRTRRHQAEDALRESEERYRLMVEAIPLMAWHCAADGSLIEANRRWYKYTGQTRRTAAGNGWMRALHPDDRNRVAETARADVAGGVIYEAEYRLRRAADGAFRWHVARALPMRDRGGRIIAWFGAAADIHEQKTAEEQLERRVAERTAQLRTSQTRLQRVLEGSSDGYWEWDVKADRVFFSRQLRRLFGLPADFGVLTRRKLSRLLHPDDRAQVAAAIDRVVRGKPRKDHYNLEYRLRQPGGKIVWMSSRGSVTERGPDGRALRMSGLITDVTERKQAENERQRLERQVMEAAERERERIGRDLHDSLGQLLTGLSLKAHALQSSLEGAPAKLAGMIAEHARKAVRQSRDLAASLHPVQPGPDGLVASLRACCAMVPDLFGVTCHLDCPRPVPVPDPNLALQMYRIAQEALHNAVRHGKAGRIRVELRKGKGGICLRVADNGRGFRTGAKRDGGFGLATMRYRANSVGARLRVRSRPGRGTVITCCVAPRRR